MATTNRKAKRKQDRTRLTRSKQFIVYMTEEEHEVLMSAAQRAGTPASEFTRRAVASAIDGSGGS